MGLSKLVEKLGAVKVIGSCVFLTFPFGKKYPIAMLKTVVKTSKIISFNLLIENVFFHKAIIKKQLNQAKTSILSEY
jgi:aminopeptidase C